VVIFGEHEAGAPARMEVRIQVGGMSVTCIDGQLAI
jgi:hypothetical protein